MGFDAREGLYLPRFGDAMSQGLQSGQNIRKGILENYLAEKGIAKQNKVEDLQQQYLGATNDTDKRAILGQMAVYNPEHAKGIAAIGQLGVNPFEGTSMEAQAANIQYQRLRAAGVPDAAARLQAINDVRTTNVQSYTDAMGNRVTQGGIPLPDIGGRQPNQPMLGNITPTANQPMLGGMQPTGTPTTSIMDNIAQASPEEKAFTTQFTALPPEQRAAFYKEQAVNHPDLPEELTPDLEEQLLDIGAALNEGDAILPQIDRTVTQSDLDSPAARKTRLDQKLAKSDLQSPTKNKIEEKLLNSGESLSRIKSIQSSFKPEYLQLGSRVGAAASSMKDFLGTKLSPEEAQQLSDFTGFKRASVDNMNKLLNELSGAAVSPTEGTRIAASQPNAGVGIFDGDSPTVFKRKMEDVTKQMQYATMRYNYALQNGMNPLKTGIALEEIPQFIEERGAEIEGKIKNQYPDMPQAEIDKQTKLQLGQEFGMQ